MTLANIVARMERSEIRDSRDPGPGLRGACHRAALRADPLAPSGLQPLLQGFGGSLGQNAALPDASPPPELWVASSSQSCRIPYSSSGVLFSSGAAGRMGGANGSRECAPDDKLRDTHQLLLVGRSVSQRAQPIRRASLLPLARPSSAVEYGWVASYPLCIALRSCGLPAPVFESRHDRNYKDVAHTDRLVRAARFGQERAG